MCTIICKCTPSIWLLFFNYFILQGESFVVPQELPSLLSLVYSNIPPIKKGTDSRLGFGFRLGEHADFQILVELGPQKETRPIGDSQKNEQSYNKREVNTLDDDDLQRHLTNQEVLQQNFFTSAADKNTKWLQSWSKGINSQKFLETISKTNLSNSVKTQLSDLTVIRRQAIEQLHELYKMAKSSTIGATTQPITIPDERI